MSSVEDKGHILVFVLQKHFHTYIRKSRPDEKITLSRQSEGSNYFFQN